MINRNKKISTHLRSFTLFPIVYCISIILYVLYSYTQIDLGLTLSSAGIISTLQRQFQEIGYFNRPLSTYIFTGIITVLFTLYISALRAIQHKTMKVRDLWVVVGILSTVTLIAYPAFSYDFFNYLFTAKTVLIYHKNPYLVIPLQFAGVDPWLSFMHWTHLPSAYTPLWITSTLVPYLFGFGKLGILIINLKLYITLAYVATVIGIGKILKDQGEQWSTLGMAIFALNPLVITECLISPHNDIVMMALVIWAIVAYKKSQRWASWLLLSLSVAMKLMTLALIPVFFLKWNKKISLFCMIIALGAVLFQREVLSWYWIWIIPFISLLPEYPVLTIISTGVSMGLLLRYTPYLYLGNWDPPAATVKLLVTVLCVLISVVVAFISQYRKDTR